MPSGTIRIIDTGTTVHCNLCGYVGPEPHYCADQFVSKSDLRKLVDEMEDYFTGTSGEQLRGYKFVDRVNQLISNAGEGE